MKLSFTLCTLLLLATTIGRIATINSLKSEAKKAYNEGNYTTAVKKYRYLVDSLQVAEEEVIMNLANAYFQLNDSTNAETYYNQLAQSNTPKIKSLSNQQLGVLDNRLGKFKEALTHFKQSLRADPTNKDSRYNYELIKKKLQDQEKKDQNKPDQNKKDQNKKDQDKKDQNKKDQDKKDQNKKDQDKKDQNKKDQDKKDQNKKDQNKKDQNKKDQDKKDQNKKDQNKKDQNKKDQNKKDQDKKDQDKKDQDKKDQDKKDQNKKDQDKKDQNKKDQSKKDQNKKDQNKKDIPPSVSEKLKEMKMSEEKARMILEAMKNREIQYLQQKRRKATKPKDRTKPDW